MWVAKDLKLAAICPPSDVDSDSTLAATMCPLHTGVSSSRSLLNVLPVPRGTSEGLKPRCCGRKRFRRLSFSFNVANCFYFRQQPHIGHKIAQQSGMIPFPPDKSDGEREVQIGDTQQ